MRRTFYRVLGVLAILLLVGVSGYLGFYADSADSPSSLTDLWQRLPFGASNTGVADSTPTPPQTVPVERGTVEETVIAPGQVAGAKEQIISAAVGGTIAELPVRPGDRVTAGQVVAELEKRPYQEALSLAQIELEQAEADLAQQIANAQLSLQSAETSVTSAQAGYPSLTAAQIKVEQAQRTLADTQAAYDTAFDSAREWEFGIKPMADALEAERAAASRNLQMAQDNLAIAQADLADVQNGQWANSQNVNAAQIGVEEAQLQLDTLQNQGVDPLLQWDVDKAQADLDATTVTAPFDGVVLKVNVLPGENVGAGQAMLVIADVSQGELMATAIEEDLPLVQPGQTAEIYFDAVPDSVVTGTIDRIVPQRTDSDRPLYPMYIAIEDLPENILPGMTADAVIVIDRVKDALRLPRAVVRAGSDDTATVQVWNGRTVESRDITIGLRGDTYVEILSGLAEGELVVGQ